MHDIGNGFELKNVNGNKSFYQHGFGSEVYPTSAVAMQPIYSGIVTMQPIYSGIVTIRVYIAALLQCQKAYRPSSTVTIQATC